MATHKKTAKPVSKKPAPKGPAKKAVVKKAAKPQPKAKKASKPAPKPAKKAITPKKQTPVKKAAVKSAKPAAKKVVSNRKPVPAKSKPLNKTTKPAPKKAAPVKKATVVAKKPVKAEISKKADRKPELKPLPKAKDIKVPPPKPVVLPKISTTKARKYEPEFTRSVLDQAPMEHNGPTMRYSDAELNEVRELIQRKLETAKKELAYLQGLITRKDEMGGDDTDNRYMTMEDGSLSMEREQLSQMASRQITFIDHLEKAMMRIENKTYGICRVTGKLIDKARLRAVPHATLSIEAKMGIAK